MISRFLTRRIFLFCNIFQIATHLLTVEIIALRAMAVTLHHPAFHHIALNLPAVLLAAAIDAAGMM